MLQPHPVWTHTSTRLEWDRLRCWIGAESERRHIRCKLGVRSPVSVRYRPQKFDIDRGSAVRTTNAAVSASARFERHCVCFQKKSFCMLNRLRIKRDSWQHMSRVDVIVSVNFVPVCVTWAPSFVTQRNGRERHIFLSKAFVCGSRARPLWWSKSHHMFRDFFLFFFAPGAVGKKTWTAVHKRFS